MENKKVEKANIDQETWARLSMIRQPVYYLMLIQFVLFPAITYSQDAATQIDDAVNFYQANQPTQASALLQTVLTSTGAPQLTEALKAKAYTYLAMSEWALYRRAAAESAVISALELDAAAFLIHGGDWAQNNATIIDTVAIHLLTDAVFQYEEAEYIKSIERLILIVPIEKYLSSRLAADIHKYLAFNFVAQGKRKLAQVEFQTALRYNPKLTLGDDAVVAPKIRRTYLTIRDNTLQKSRRNARLGTIIRSVILPGWGQIHRGDRLRGYGYMSIQAGLLTGSLLSVRSYSQARDAYTRFGAADALAIYNRQNDIDEVKAELNTRYSRYQSKGRQTNVFVGLFATVWAVNIIDAMILSWRRDQSEFTSATPSSGHLALNWDQDRQVWQVQYQLKW